MAYSIDPSIILSCVVVPLMIVLCSWWFASLWLLILYLKSMPEHFFWHVLTNLHAVPVCLTGEGWPEVHDTDWLHPQLPRMVHRGRLQPWVSQAAGRHHRHQQGWVSPASVQHCSCLCPLSPKCQYCIRANQFDITNLISGNSYRCFYNVIPVSTLSPVSR